MTDCQPSPDLQNVANIATIIGASGVVFAVISLFSARTTFRQSIIADCAKRFQLLRPGLVQPSQETLIAYLELCNEELFYFEKRYLPQAVIDEWVEGLVGYVGLWRDGEAAQLPGLPPPSLPLNELQNQLQCYPRLRHAVELTAAAAQRIGVTQHDYPPEEQADAARAQAVLEVLANLSHYRQQPFYRHLQRQRRRKVIGF